MEMDGALNKSIRNDSEDFEETKKAIEAEIGIGESPLKGQIFGIVAKVENNLRMHAKYGTVCEIVKQEMMIHHENKITENNNVPYHRGDIQVQAVG